MVEKIKSTVFDFVKRLSDVRFLGQVIFVIIVLLVSWSTSKAIQTNYDLQRDIAQKQKVNDLQKLKNENLKIQNQYLQTDEYLELAARQQLGKAAPGETLIVIPKETAMKYTVASSIKTDAELQQTVDNEKPFYQKNLEAWGKFFFRR